jgi:carboxyl-terminal processing protease
MNRPTAAFAATCAISLLLAASPSGQAPAAPATAAATDANQDAVRARNAATFEAVWTTVRDTHWDPTLGGVDWPAVRVELLPRAEAAADDAALRVILMDALGRLKQSHFTIIPGELSAATEDEPTNTPTATDAPTATPAPRPTRVAREGHCGATVSFMARASAADRWDAVVTAVEPGSPAEKAGISPGMRVAAIDGRPLGERLPPGDGLERYERAQVAYALTTADPGTTRTWRIEPIGAEASDVTVTYAADERPHSKFGSLPSLPTELTWRHLDQTERERWGAGNHEIGLVRFNIWLIPVARPFDQAMDTLRTADGIVIDLRGNPGGIGAMAMGIAGHFTPEISDLGEMRTRDTTLHFNTNPRRVSTTGVAVQPYTGPVAILVDDATASTSEIFAGGMQYLGRAKVFGERTAGAALPAIMLPLPNGDVFLHAVADYRLPNGNALEASGVKPDNARPYTRADFAREGDPALAEAVRWIAAQPAAAR